MRVPKEVVQAIFGGNYDERKDIDFNITPAIASVILGENLELYKQETLLEGTQEVKNGIPSPVTRKAHTFLNFVAEQIIKDAFSALPDDWIFSPSGEKKDPINIQVLKNKWTSSSIQLKLEIARMLNREFNPKHDSNGVASNSVERDYSKPRIVNTSMDRVLPKKYGKWEREKGTDNLPNCLGKFQLLVAFGDYLNVPMLSIATIKEHFVLANEVKRHFATEILSFFDRHKLTLKEERRTSLTRSIAFVDSLESCKLFQHLSVAFKASEDQWIVIDPNMRISSIAPEEWGLEKKHSYIKQQKQNSSLLSFQVTSDEVSEICSLAKRQFDNLLIEIEDTFGAIKASIEIPEGTDPDLTHEDYFYKTLKKYWEEMEGDLQAKIDLATLQHPAVEICDARMRLASATLSHVAYEISDECGDAVEQILFALGIVQGHLYNVASSILRNPSQNRDFSDLAFLVLERIPVLSVMNEGLIKRKKENAND